MALTLQRGRRRGEGEEGEEGEERKGRRRGGAEEEEERRGGGGEEEDKPWEKVQPCSQTFLTCQEGVLLC